MIWFWYFLWYSFVGFLLEVLYAHLTGNEPQRKCLLVLPLCPVYGVGACVILIASQNITSPLVLLFTGTLLATTVEYIFALFYEQVLGVTFWNYENLPFHLHGRVCVPFSIAWGLLSLLLVQWIHPLIAPWATALPTPLAITFFCTFLCDTLVSSLLLKRSGRRDCLDWYRKRA